MSPPTRPVPGLPQPTDPTAVPTARPTAVPQPITANPPADSQQRTRQSAPLPGLLVLHGNRTELLGDAVFAWLARHPLPALVQEVFLVQSNGVAEWLKMALASQSGVFAAARVELPARFLWRTYRQVLGPGAVPAESPLDKLPLTWCLMQALPLLAQQPGFEPLAGFLHGGDADRRLQLAQRLADLLDQYQVYRADWLDAWAAGHDVLPRTVDEPPASAPPLPADQRWQAALWRALLQPLDADARASSRPQLQQRFLAALQALPAGQGMADAAASTSSPVPANGQLAIPALPPRVVLFGMAHVPLQTLQALAALAGHCQVLLAVPNPCRYHWADTIAGRDLLRLQRHRHPLRGARDLAALPLDVMHAHAHPLLAAWGRQGRDFVRQLDAFDDAQAARQRFALPRIDLFDEAAGHTLLQQVQAHIRDLLPLAEHPQQAVPADDLSIVFNSAHSAQREVEILHDQLLALLAAAPGGEHNSPLQPRDIVVMVPEIDSFAPAIRAVFGQPARSDARHIPFDITDLQERGYHPVLLAVEWLLRLPQQRCGLSALRDLLDVPALASRYGLGADDLPRLALWADGAGIRWGLDAEQRSSLGLDACGEQNTWLFGLRRMLLGYAVGDGLVDGFVDGFVQDTATFHTIQPYAEVGGLEAALAGSLAALIDALLHWRNQALQPAAPLQWATRCSALLDAFFRPTTERERLTLTALQDALQTWLTACDAAGFDDAVPLSVAREAWLGGVDAPGLNHRFQAGGVTFCTLLPMRAVPFEVVCLLGMNDGDYPRSSQRSDFDLMGQPGQARPGDRSRRDDDRQLMLEALLSARRVLSISWAGRSARDNSLQPPSVLVSQLRDYLQAGWAGDVLGPRTTEHPLQPFSRRYFEQADVDTAPAAGQPLFTHAREWRAAHAAASAANPPLPSFVADPQRPLTLASLARFLKNPVKAFFRARLAVVFQDAAQQPDDDEAFEIDGLAGRTLLDEVLQGVLLQWPPGQGAAPVDAPPAPDLATQVAHQVQRLVRAGRLPLAEAGRRSAQDLHHTALPMLQRWWILQAAHPVAAAPLLLRVDLADLPLPDLLQPDDEPARPATETSSPIRVDDWLDGLHASTTPNSEPVWLQLQASALWDAKKKAPRADRLVDAWVRCVVASACGAPVHGVIVARDVTLHLQPLPQAQAQVALRDLLQAWHIGMDQPLPLPCRTGLALVTGANDVASVYQGGAFARGGPGEVVEPCLARLYPDFETLTADGQFSVLAQRLLAPLALWADQHITAELAQYGPTAGAAVAE